MAPRFNLAAQVKKLGADSLLPRSRKKQDPWESYEIRTGGDGKVGIYTRDYNCRLATFNANTFALQHQLELLFNRAARVAAAAKTRKRRAVKPDYGVFMNDGVHERCRQAKRMEGS